MIAIGVNAISLDGEEVEILLAYDGRLYEVKRHVDELELLDFGKRNGAGFDIIRTPEKLLQLIKCGAEIAP